MRSPLNIALIQTTLAWENIAANLQHFDHLLSKAPQNTHLMVLPEMFNTGFAVEPKRVYETMEGTTMQWMRAQAARYNMVIAGSLVIKADNKYYNRLIWMRPDGSYEYYDKRHLFRLGKEHLHFTGGTQSLITELNGWRIRPLICYDLRFPVWAKNSYNRGDYAYDILLYMANWPARRSFAWNTLLPARAIENQCYTLGVNRIGEDGNGLPHSGNSIILDFRGHELAKAQPDTETILHTTLHDEPLHEFRKAFTVGMDWDDFTIAQ